MSPNDIVLSTFQVYIRVYISSLIEMAHWALGQINLEILKRPEAPANLNKDGLTKLKLEWENPDSQRLLHKPRLKRMMIQFFELSQ